MKRIFIHIITIVLFITGMVSCKKTEDVIQSTASLTILNCFSDGTYLFPEFYNSTNVSFADKNRGIAAPLGISLTPYMETGLSVGTVPLRIYAFPDSINILTSRTMDLKAGGIYSFFVAGTKSAVDTLFIKDELPAVSPLDSMIIVRVVNLAKTDQPLKVNILGQATAIPSMESMNYKDISSFRTFGVKKAQYTADFFSFEVRNALTDEIVNTFNYYWNFPSSQGGGTHYMSKAATIVLVNSGATVRSIIVNPKLQY